MVEILDEYGNHVCYMDENSKEYEKMLRKEKAKQAAAVAISIGVVAGKICLVGGLIGLGVKVARNIINS